MSLTKPQAYAVAATLSGLAWFLPVYACQSTAVASPSNSTAFAVFLLCGSGAGLVVSYLFRGAFRRARLPWAFFLPLATVPVGISVFAALVWAARLGFGYRPTTHDLELVLSDLLTGMLFFYPIVYVLSFINQWILHVVLIEHGAYQPGSRSVRLFVLGALLLWVVFLVWAFAPSIQH